MSQSLRSGSEDKLISISKQYHEAIASRDANGLEALLSDSATLYSDGVIYQKHALSRFWHGVHATRA